jgi:hypothetical protein
MAKQDLRDWTSDITLRHNSHHVRKRETEHAICDFLGNSYLLIALGVFVGADAPNTLFWGHWNLGRKDADDEWTFVAFLAILKSQVAGRSVDRPCVCSQKNQFTALFAELVAMPSQLACCS